MARKPRIHFPGACYYVIARGNRGQTVFLDDEDYALYLAFMREYTQRYHCKLFAYCLTPDHVHLLMQVAQTPLSRLMQVLQFRYCRNFNLKYDKQGHLFQGRYQSILFEKDAYIAALSASIHLSPVRAGLVDDPAAYAWSSFSRYVNGNHRDGFVDVDDVLSQFSGDLPSAGESYRRFAFRRSHEESLESLKNIKERNLLGSKPFVDRIHRAYSGGSANRPAVALPDISTAVSSWLKIPEAHFFSASRNRSAARARSMVGYLARKLGGYQVKTVAAYFNRSAAVLSQGMKRLEQGMAENGPLSRGVKRLEKTLISSPKQRSTTTERNPKESQVSL